MTEPTRADEVRRAPSMCAVFQATVRARTDALALRSSDGQVEITWREYGERVRRLAAGLARLGVARGDTVAIMLTNRPEFHLIDTAVMHLGATAFSIYNTSSPEQIDHVFSTAGNRAVVCEQQFRERMRAASERWGIQHIVCVDRDKDGVIGLDELEALGDPGFEFDATWRAVGRDDVVTLIFTSGTTGPPKAVEVTHANLLYSVGSALDTPETLGGRLSGGHVLSFLPDAHMANRKFAHYLPMSTGATIVTVREGRTVVEVAREVQPTVFAAVPMLWYKLKAAAEHLLTAEGERADVRATLGLANVVAGISGGAPIASEVLEFFLSLDIPVLEGWAMSETSGAGLLNPPGRMKPGTVGRPVRGTEIALAADGELLVRSPGVMKGYRNHPKATAEVIDAGGWLHTGDVATVDVDGYVTIVDRKKELIINSAGKNMSPASIENAVKMACPMAGSVVAIGDRRPYVVALLTLDPEAGARFAATRGLTDTSPAALSADSDVHAEIQAGVERANATLSRAEQIRAFTILPAHWLPDGDELTPTGKVKRRVIAEKYAAEIEEAYSRPNPRAVVASA